MKKILFSILLVVSCLTGLAQESIHPVLTGDYPDPSVLRDGNDYYMTHSTFQYKPGFLIWHSTDLVHWEPFSRVLPATTGDVWAPDLTKCNGKYYIYYPANGTNYVMWAENIGGPWSEPIDLHLQGIDPGHVQGSDGSRWLHTSGGYVVRLSDDGLRAVGEQKHVYEGWKYPESWQTECFCLESPKLTYHDGWYYLTSAQGGTAGPATSHMVVTARSLSPTGPWENSPYNPIVHTASADETWWSRGHGTLVEGPDGHWWVFYHGYRKGYHTLGRQTLMEPIEWTADGWFKAAANVPTLSPTHQADLSDSFMSGKLGWQWTFWKEYPMDALHWSRKGLGIDGRGNKPGDGRVMLTIPTDTSYEATIDLTIPRHGSSGLLLFYNEKGFAGLTLDRNTLTVYRNAGDQETMPNRMGNRVSVRLTNRCNRMTLSVSRDGRRTWQVVASNIDVSQLHHNRLGSFLSLRLALLANGSGRTTLSHFTYRGL